jgi:hypothetical protein
MCDQKNRFICISEDWDYEIRPSRLPVTRSPSDKYVCMTENWEDEMRSTNETNSVSGEDWDEDILQSGERPTFVLTTKCTKRQIDRMKKRCPACMSLRCGH